MPRFRTKVDWWVGIAIVSAPLASVVAAIAPTIAGDTAGAVVGWLTLAAVAALYVGIVWPIVYELHEHELVIRFGLARSRIPYTDIVAVTPSRDPLSSPAMSLRRLKIARGAGGYALISPADREGFLLELHARTPQLAHLGDRLVLAAAQVEPGEIA